MVHKSEPPDRGLRPITVRLAASDYSLLSELASARNASLNSIVSEAVAQYGTKIRREQALSQIQAFQRRLQETHAPGMDSLELLREAREERSERLSAGRSASRDGRGGKERSGDRPAGGAAR